MLPLHWHPHCRPEGSNQYGACAAPATMPDQNCAGRWYSTAAASQKGVFRRQTQPLNATFFVTIEHGVMSTRHITISRPPLALKRYEQRVQTMNTLMVSFQHQAESADSTVDFWGGGGQKLDGACLGGSLCHNHNLTLKLFSCTCLHTTSDDDQTDRTKSTNNMTNNITMALEPLAPAGVVSLPHIFSNAAVEAI
jgi:hypothetical protein